jgi:MFS family permease
LRNRISQRSDAAAMRVVIVSTLALFIIFGIWLSFSVFFAQFVAAEAWSNEAAAAIFSVSMVVFALGSTPAGILLDRFGARIVFSGGALLLTAGLFLSSIASNIEQLTFAYGVVGGFGLSIMGLGPMAASVAAWVPPHRRGFAIGTAFAGTGLGALLFVPLSTWLIEQYSWRGAYAVLALICLLVLTPLLMLGLLNPQRTPVHSKVPTTPPAFKRLLGSPAFWILMLLSFTALGSLRSLTVHQVAYLESVGVSRATAATYIGFAGFLTAVIFAGGGYLSDRFGRALTYVLGSLCLFGAVIVLILMRETQGMPALILYSVLMAFGEGTRSNQPTTLAIDIFQDSGSGLVNGLVGAMFGLGAASGPWIVGRLRDSTGSYLPGLEIVIVMILISGVGFAIISRTRDSRKRAQGIELLPE